MSNGHRKLPVFTTVGAVLRRLAEDLLDYALLALPMFLYWTFATYLQVSHAVGRMMHADFSAVRFDPLMLLIQIFGIAVYTMTFTNIARRTLIGRNGPRNAIGLGWGLPEFRTLGRWLLLLIVTIVLCAPAFLAGLVAWASRHDTQLTGSLEVILWFAIPATAVLFIFFYCRTITYPIAAALDDKLDLLQAFHSTRSNVWRILGCFVLTILPFLIVLFVIGAILGTPMRLVMAGRSLLLVLPIYSAINTVLAVAGIVLTALIYERLVLVPKAEGEIETEDLDRLREARGF